MITSWILNELSRKIFLIAIVHIFLALFIIFYFYVHVDIIVSNSFMTINCTMAE